MAIATACAPEATPVPESASARADVPAEGANAAGMVFDPARVQTGDTVAGLRVAESDVRQADDGEWIGSVRFEGAVTVGGGTIAHPDHPDVAEPCFLLDSATASRLPRWRGDVRRPWFCFANAADAMARLGAPDSPRRAVLIVSDFTIHYARSDVVNTARLERVDSLDAIAAP